jgi:glycosyltransferase involved in cell wall biosynthesis
MPGALHIPAGIFVRHRELFSGRQCWRQRHGFVEEDFLMGAFVSPRDLDRLLRAFAPVAASGAKLLVFSPFPPDAAARAEALGLANLVRFLEGPAEMSALDAVVVVSAGEEFVFRTMEAMAAARACVATAPHPIEDNRSGLLVNADADSVAEALARLVDSPHLCVRLGYAAREQALAEFDERKTVRAYEALYRRLLLAQAAAAAA